MKLRIIVSLIAISNFLGVYSQELKVDTIALHYYKRYEVKPGTDSKNGSFEEVYKDKVITKGLYSEGKRTGSWKFTGMNDTLQQEGEYKDDLKSGTWKSYYPNSAVSCIMPYSNGKKNGVFKGYFSNGNLSFETNYVNDSAEGISTEYYKTGKPFKIETYKGDTLNGIVKKYYESGTLKEEKFMKGEDRDSTYLFYYEDGSLWEHILYRKGSPYTVVAYNDANGKPIDCCTLKEGTGVMRFYDKEGRMTSETTYKNSVRDGHVKYAEKGVLVKEGDYSDGKFSGIWKYYFPTGKQSSKITCANDNREGDAEYYYEDGTVSQKGVFVNDEKSGLWTGYDKKGKVESEVEYKDGRMNGDAKYYEEGKLVCEGKNNKGTRIYVWTFYDKKGKVSYSYDYGYTFVSAKDKLPQPPSTGKETALSIVETMPSFPGGESMMMEFIQKNIVYPRSARDANMAGTVYVNFVIGNTGEIENVNVLKGVISALDNESIRVVEAMPRWTPGMQNGRPVRVSFNLPIKYKLR
ncbi:MAG: TonB family protein [Bacteroidia bacterium]